MCIYLIIIQKITNDKMDKINKMSEEMKNNFMKRILKEGTYYKLNKLRKYIETNDISIELLDKINDTLYDFIEKTKK